jgi:hypothetical protein
LPHTHSHSFPSHAFPSHPHLWLYEIIHSIFVIISFHSHDHSYLLPTPFVLLVATIALTHTRSRALRSLAYISLSLADTVSTSSSPSPYSHTRIHTRTTYLLVAHRSRATTRSSNCAPYRSSTMPPTQHASPYHTDTGIYTRHIGNHGILSSFHTGIQRHCIHAAIGMHSQPSHVAQHHMTKPWVSGSSPKHSEAHI